MDGATPPEPAANLSEARGRKRRLARKSAAGGHHSGTVGQPDCKDRGMARYFFDIVCDGQVISDDDGLELRDAEQARREAVAGARSMMAADLLSGVVALNQRIEVRDGSGAMVLALPFEEAVEFQH
jgi:hypothetical protein